MGVICYLGLFRKSVLSLQLSIGARRGWLLMRFPKPSVDTIKKCLIFPPLWNQSLTSFIIKFQQVKAL